MESYTQRLELVLKLLTDTEKIITTLEQEILSIKNETESERDKGWELHCNVTYTLKDFYHTQARISNLRKMLRDDVITKSQDRDVELGV